MSKYPLNTNRNFLPVDIRIKKTSGTPVFLTMALDTGASMTSIPGDAAITIGCDPTKSRRKIEIITASGSEYVAIITVPRFFIWGTELKNVDVICLNLPPKSTVSGLLGMNILKKFDVLLKFRSKILEIC